MKIFILRHEDRTQDCSFFAPLTLTGLNNSEILAKQLEKCDINLVYSSPFIRTLQTVLPFISANGLKINLEYGLSEIHNEDIIPKKAVGILLPEYLCEKYNYNKRYISKIPSTKIKYPEKYTDVINRIKLILKYIIKKYLNTNNNILLVTHQSLCCAILEIINKQKIFNISINKDLITNYPKGKISLIFDNNEWVYKSIN